MAIPNPSCPPGQLSMLAMAQEALYGTYGSGSITGPISLYDMINSGDTKGSGNSYPTINTNSVPNPITRDGSNSLELTNVNDVMGSFGSSLYYKSSIGNASNLGLGDYLYLNPALTQVYCGVGTFQQPGSNATTTHCGSGSQWYFVVNADSASSDFGKIIQSNACS